MYRKIAIILLSSFAFSISSNAQQHKKKVVVEEAPAEVAGNVSGVGIMEAPEPIQADSNKVFYYVSQMPEFLEGDVQSWLSKNVKYPESARKEKVAGRVIVEFTIAPTGEIIEPKIRRSAGNEALDQEALRVVRLMPDWKAGRNSGSPVSVRITQPITFKLD